VQIPAGSEEVLSIDPEVMHGKLCFKGTRVPFAVFLDNVEEGMKIREFLEEYPSVTRIQAEAAAAGPVYKLLGKKDMGTTEFPPIETPLIDGDVAFRQHSGGHTPGPNWPTFITFASRYLKSTN